MSRPDDVFDNALADLQTELQAQLVGLEAERAAALVAVDEAKAADEALLDQVETLQKRINDAIMPTESLPSQIGNFVHARRREAHKALRSGTAKVALENIEWRLSTVRAALAQLPRIIDRVNVHGTAATQLPKAPPVAVQETAAPADGESPFSSLMEFPAGRAPAKAALEVVK